MKTLKRAGLLVRVSQNRVDDRARPERQLARCRALIEAKDFELAATYLDDNESA